MPQAKYVLGELEKHEILVQSSYWTGQVKVDADGKRVADTYTLGFPKSLSFTIGENEKFEIVINVTPSNSFETYANGKLIGRTHTH